MPAIYLEPRQVPATLRGSYRGNAFKVNVTESVTIPADAGLWDGGSRDHYFALRIADGAQVPFPGQDLAPWDKRESRKIILQAGLAVVEHSISRGKDMGLTFYLHPTDAAPMLPAPVELSAIEQLVLDYTAGRKSSYNGKDRYMMAHDDFRYGYRKPGSMATFPSRGDWDSAKAALVDRGYLNKAGAISVAGRNAANRV